jgi:hypothetical protein
MMPINIGTKILLFCEAIVSSESSNMTPRVYPGRSDLGHGHLHDDILTGWTAQYVPWAFNKCPQAAYLAMPSAGGTLQYGNCHLNVKQRMH